MKINNLTPSAGPLNGSEPLPTVKGGGTKKITTAQIAALGQVVGMEGASVLAAVYDALQAENGADLVGHRSRTVYEHLDDVVNLLDHGVVADNATGAATAINAAADLARVAGKGLYLPRCILPVYVDAEIDLTGIRRICFETPLRVNPAIASVPVTVGGFAGGDTISWDFDDVTDGTNPVSAPVPSRPVMRVVGAKHSQMSFGSCNYLQFYADDSLGAGYTSTAYNQIWFSGVQSKIELADAGAFSWITENRFYGGRIIRFHIEGTSYPHNHNFFYEPTCEEADFEAVIINASHNHFINVRGESIAASAGISFDADSYGNLWSFTWSGAGNPRNDYVLPCPVSDLGQGNLVTRQAAINRQKVPLLNVGPNSGIIASATASVAAARAVSPVNPNVDNLTDVPILTPSLAGFSVGAFRYIALTELIPVERGDVVLWEGDYSGDLLRTSTFVYDADQNLLTVEGAGGAYIDQPGAAIDAGNVYGRYAQASDQSAESLRQSPITVIRSEVKYIRIGAFSGAGGFIRNLSASLFVNKIGRGAAEQAREIFSMRSLNGAPVAGYVPAGTMLYNHAAPAWLRAVYAWESFTTGPLLAGANSLTIANAGAIANGDIVGILLDSGLTHWSTVSALAGATFTVSPLPSPAAAGARVTFNRWG